MVYDHETSTVIQVFGYSALGPRLEPTKHPAVSPGAAWAGANLSGLDGR